MPSLTAGERRVERLGDGKDAIALRTNREKDLRCVSISSSPGFSSHRSMNMRSIAAVLASLPCVATSVLARVSFSSNTAPLCRLRVNVVTASSATGGHVGVLDLRLLDGGRLGLERPLAVEVESERAIRVGLHTERRVGWDLNRHGFYLFKMLFNSVYERKSKSQ